MKRPALTLICIIILFFAQAQEFKKLPAFGDVTKEELQMTECSFDKGAAAMVIFNEGEAYARLNFIQTDFRVRIKILNKKGYDQANVKIRYVSNNRDVSIAKFSAQTYNIDASGNVIATKVDKASVYDKRINSRFSERSFAFPDVREGSIIEYKYTLENTSQSFWYFQKSIPVALSRFIINFPPEFIVSAVPHCSLPMQKASNDREGEGNFSWYTMQNVPAFSIEPYMSCAEDYLQRMEVRLTAVEFRGSPRTSLLRSWPGIIKEMVDDEDFGRQLKKDIPRTVDLDEKLKTASTPFVKMTTIYNYVRSNMEWNGAASIWALDGVKNAWKNKKGTAGEINLILINLLKDAGLDVIPLLASTKDNGLVNTWLADYNQFDRVMAYVTIDNSVYILDATDKATPSHLFPLSIMATEGMLIAKLDSYEWGWRTLWDNEHLFDRTVVINALADSIGNLKGTATISAKDYERCKLLPEGVKSLQSLKSKFEGRADVTIDSIDITNEEIDSLPLTGNISFSSKGTVSGDYSYFKLNLFTGLENNPFVAEERNSDIFFSANQKYELHGVIFLPDEYEVEELPGNLRMIMPDTSISFTRHCTYSDGMLSVHYKLEFLKPFFSKEQYPEFREFYKKLFDMLNEPFVYRKRNKK